MLTVSGDVTVSNPITIANSLLTVSGDVTVSNPITIANSLLTVSGDVTVSNPITIANALLTVSGDVTVNNPVTIANALLTVSGDVTVNNPITIANALLTVSGDITITNSVTLANSLLTVFVEGNQFTALTDVENGATSIGTSLTLTNISQLRTATMFIDNTGANPITVTLQLSPDGLAIFDDPHYTNVPIAGGTSTIMVVDLFAQYAQIAYDAGTIATFTTYFNGQA